MHARVELLLASSNPGKLREYQALAEGHPIELALLPRFDSLPRFPENAPTFAENAAGKALHYSSRTKLPVLADDSGLVVPALGGAPGMKSARYAGPRATDADRIHKLLSELKGRPASERAARFVCVIAVAERGRMLDVISSCVAGELIETPRGEGGFGYDPIFFYPPSGKTFAELSKEEKNRISHRGLAFRKLLAVLG